MAKNVVNLKTDGTTTTVDIEDDELAALQRGVDGYIEMVRLSSRCDMYVNEEGKIKDLPINRFATTLYWYANPDAAREGDFIVGDVVITGGTDRGGETRGLSEAKQSAITSWLNNQQINLDEIVK